MKSRCRGLQGRPGAVWAVLASGAQPELRGAWGSLLGPGTEVTTQHTPGHRGNNTHLGVHTPGHTHTWAHRRGVSTPVHAHTGISHTHTGVTHTCTHTPAHTHQLPLLLLDFCSQLGQGQLSTGQAQPLACVGSCAKSKEKGQVQWNLLLAR